MLMFLIYTKRPPGKRREIFNGTIVFSRKMPIKIPYRKMCFRLLLYFIDHFAFSDKKTAKKTFSLKAICRTKFICSCDTCTCVCIQQYVAFTYCSLLDTNYWFIQRLPLNFSKVPLSALFCGGVINLSLVKAKRSYKLIYSLPFCEVLKNFLLLFLLLLFTLLIFESANWTISINFLFIE